MNILLLGLVLYSYFVSSAPKVLKENKQLVLGMFIGVTIYQMNLVEGIDGECITDYLPDDIRNKYIDNRLFTSASQIEIESKWNNPAPTTNMFPGTNDGPCSGCVCRRNTGSDDSPAFWCCDKDCAGWCEDNEGNILERSTYIDNSSDNPQTACEGAGNIWNPPLEKNFTDNYEDSNSSVLCSDTTKTYIGSGNIGDGYPYFEHANLCNVEDRFRIINEDVNDCKGLSTSNYPPPCKFWDKEKTKTDYTNLRKMGAELLSYLTTCSSPVSIRIKERIDSLQSQIDSLTPSNDQPPI